MKSTFHALLFAIIILFFFPEILYAQQPFSSKENSTAGEIRKYVEGLAKQATHDANAKLQLEAETLRKAGNEELMILASDIYLKYLNKRDSAQNIKQEIIQ